MYREIFNQKVAKVMGKRWGVVALLLSILSACQSPTEELGEVVALHETAAMEILDGTTGSTVTLTDAKDIEAIESFLSPVHVNELRFSEQGEGYRYRLTLKSGNSAEDTIVFLGDRLEINGEMYKTEENVDSSFF